jgi:multiple sugar transport system substrate-binding protein
MTARRRVAAVLTVTVLGLSVAACGSSGSKSSSPQTLDVLVQSNSIYPTQQTQWFREVSAQFKKLTGSTVKFETFAAPTDELTKIQTSVLSGQGPDVYSLGTTFTPTAYATGAFEVLTSADWAKIGGKSRFLPATLGISGPDDAHQVGIPLRSRPFVMAYNKSMLAAAGITAPATTWDGLRQQAQTLTKSGVYGLAVAYGDGFDPWKFIWAMSIQAGNPLVVDGKAQLNQPTVQAAYQTYLGWLAADKVVDPAAVGWKNAQAIAAFGAGKAAFLPMVSASSKVTLDKSSVAGNYAYALMPTVPPGATDLPSGGVGASSILSGDNLVVAKYSKNKDLVFKLINMLTSASSEEAYYRTFGDLPTNAQAAKDLESDPALAPIVDSAGKSHNTPFNGAWSQVQLSLVNVVVQSIPNLNKGKVDPGALTALINKAQSDAQTALDKAQ